MRTLALAVAVAVAACGTPPPRSTMAVTEETIEPPALPAPPTPNAPRLTRAALDETLDAGPGAFLGRVKLKAVVAGGRFVGWEVVQMDPVWSGAGVRVGDVVERVNGLPVERPDDFAAVWQMLRGAAAVEIAIRRAGDESVVRVPVVE